MRIRDTKCSTCIYRPGSPLDVAALEDEVRDPIAPWHFRGARACHGEGPANTAVLCRGFADRHGDRCTLIQLLLRLPASSSGRAADEPGNERQPARVPAGQTIAAQAAGRDAEGASGLRGPAEVVDEPVDRIAGRRPPRLIVGRQQRAAAVAGGAEVDH